MKLGMVKLLSEQQQGVSHSVPLYPGGQKRADALQVPQFYTGILDALKQ